jgi:hypothetical protein
MPFGLCNAPATFQRYILSCVLGITNCMPYMDDILIFSNNIQDHVEDVRKVLTRFSQNGLKLKLSKCQFGLSRVKYLGHIVSKDGIMVNPSKIECVNNLSPPKNISELQSFLGLCNYYNKFIPSYANICNPLYKLLKKNVKYVWDEGCEQAFKQLKNKLTTAPVLATPRYDKPFIIHTDASMEGVGGILSQLDDSGQEHPIIYISRALKPAEKNYPTTHQELLAIVYAMQKFRPYVLGQPFTIYTDHQPLVHIRNTKELTGRLARWILYLEPYTANGNMNIVYKPGKKNTNADALSRLVLAVSKNTRAGIRGRVQRERESKREEDELFIQQQNEQKGGADMGPVVSLDAYAKKIIELQKVDPMWKHIYAYVSMNEYVDEYKVDTKKQTELQEKCMQYMIIHDQLYHIYMMNNKQQEECSVLQLCLPRVMVEEILKELHDEHGHLSTYKTYVTVMHRYYWMGMYDDIHRHCLSCEACIKRKTPHHTSPIPMLSPQKDMMGKYGAGECVAIDWIGPLPLSSNRKTGMLTMIDHYTRWAAAFALPRATTKHIVNTIITQWVCHFGMPRVLMSDNGSVFKSHVMKKLCEMISVKQKFVLPYQPSSNGINERFNGTIVNMIATYISDQEAEQKDWDRYLPYAVFAYNTSTHPATGYTPYMLMHGREAIIGSEGMISSRERDTHTHSYPLYLQHIHSNLSRAHANTKDRVERKAEEREKINSTYSKQHLFNVGDVVYVYVIPRSNKAEGVASKLLSPFEGPYVVTHRYNEVSYQVKHKHTNKLKKVHTSRMKLVVAASQQQLASSISQQQQQVITNNEDTKQEGKEEGDDDELLTCSDDDNNDDNTDDHHDDNNDDDDNNNPVDEIELEEGEVRWEDYVKMLQQRNPHH